VPSRITIASVVLEPRVENGLRDVRVAIVGAGFGGIGAAIRLREAGYEDLVILERADGLGGTWWANTYPGCACDVAAHLYSFSFALNPDWSRFFAPQAEILDYLRHVARDRGIEPLIRFGTEVTGRGGTRRRAAGAWRPIAGPSVRRCWCRAPAASPSRSCLPYPVSTASPGRCSTLRGGTTGTTWAASAWA
jgi:hypothetical protein